MIEYTVKVQNNGNRLWYLDDKLHLHDGPAIEYADGGKLWFINDQLHREDGPAVEYADGYKEYYLNGKQVTKAEHKTVTQPVKEMTLEQAVDQFIKYVQIVKGNNNGY